MTVAFMIAGIMLATLKYYIIDWLMGQWLRKENFSDFEGARSTGGVLTSSSLYERTLGELPTWGMLSIVGIYLLSKTAELVEIYELPVDYVASLRAEGSKILGIIVGWYIVILAFRILKERGFVSAANQHIAKLAEGNSQQFTSTFGAGAWGQIYSALNSASETMAQRTRLERGLASYAVESVVKRVIKTDTLETYGELKAVTILMSDLRNFTMMANAMEPKTVVEVLNIYFNDMIEILTRYQFTIDKFIGDGILAYIDPDNCGNKNPNQLAMAAAIQMHSQMVMINKKLSDKGYPPLQMGVALHHGNVIVGSIGSKDRLQHTIIGDAVNVAARLEGLCKVHSCGVVLSSHIYGTLHEAHRSICRDLGLQSVRGITEAVQLYGVTIE
jgi:class 3 adenylate cyclase